jgi:hypothetical protein
MGPDWDRLAEVGRAGLRSGVQVGRAGAGFWAVGDGLET